MKKSAVFVNIGRGNSVNEDDLVKALQEEMIAGAALDVFKVEPLPTDHLFWSLPNMILSPHSACYSNGIAERDLAILVKNAQAFTKGEPFTNVCDKKLGY